MRLRSLVDLGKRALPDVDFDFASCSEIHSLDSLLTRATQDIKIMLEIERIRAYPTAEPNIVRDYIQSFSKKDV